MMQTRVPRRPRMNGLRLVICLVAAAVVGVSEAGDKQHENKRFPKQINKGIILDEEDEDRKAEGTGFESFGGFDGGGGGGGGGGGKYFMYQHVPKKDHYEFGFKRGNEHHVKERHEKAHPHVGHFKTKVRWADTHGGHGEHYWDYNHHGHHSDEGGADGDEASERVNSYEALNEDRSKRDEVSSGGVKTRLGRQPAGFDQDPVLTYNDEAKTVTDQNTGQVYLLYPID